MDTALNCVRVDTVREFSKWSVGAPNGPLFVQLTESISNLQFRLFQNYPNPFNPSTEIRFSLPLDSRVTLIVYNLLGQEIVRLVDDNLPAGIHTSKWDAKDKGGKNVSSGLYFLKIIAAPQRQDSPTFTQVRKILLLK